VSTRGPAVALLLTVVVTGCGGTAHHASRQPTPPNSRPTLPTPGERRAVETVARRFADAVNGGRPATLCRLLRAQAWEQQGCGGRGEDIGPLLNLAIDRRSDVRVASVAANAAVVHIPSPANQGVQPPIPKGVGPPQVLHLRRIGGRWYLTRVDLREAAR
jgi:hypothetical protein